ncbi:hypothetical protein CJ030_MR1G023590 [Morella rubra]|uniref:Uncharacterized protein n=1 Tax=Morella rubra TaxID=262757 RepID=A0A6A1WR15_9ROSI|nr:hypothetical protein CJ030_MR1G023590 [Morella rubra]
MPEGGKRLRCDLSVRAKSTPGTLAVFGPSLRDCNELPSGTITSLVGTQSSCTSTFGIKHEKGSMLGTALLKACTGGKLIVLVLDGRMGGDDKASSMLSSHIGIRAPVSEMNKEEWTCVCDLFASEEFQKRSAISRENRAMLKIVHTSGAGKNGGVTVAERVRGKAIHISGDFRKGIGDESGLRARFRPFSTEIGGGQMREQMMEHIRQLTSRTTPKRKFG